MLLLRAARAGEAKGFTVIADRNKETGRTVRESVNTINTMLQNFKTILL